ncbi:MAG: hypothetical protein KIS75_06675, partial [Chromatiales bacterium]|nr:hypothetical protein [Chromatiales bacterium]
MDAMGGFSHGLAVMAWIVIGVVRAVARVGFDARGGAHSHSFLLLAQKKRTKEKGTRRLAPRR